MQYQRLTDEQKRIRKWRMKRNSLVGKLMEEDRKLSGQDALRKANMMMIAERKNVSVAPVEYKLLPGTWCEHRRPPASEWKRYCVKHLITCILLWSRNGYYGLGYGGLELKIKRSFVERQNLKTPWNPTHAQKGESE
jgi:hypothetical protein